MNRSDRSTFAAGGAVLFAARIVWSARFAMRDPEV